MKAEIRVFLLIEEMQRQYTACIGSPLRARGYIPMEGMHSLVIEIAPGLAVHRAVDAALKASPEAEPGILFVERQFGVLELHARSLSELKRAGEAALKAVDARAEEQLKPSILCTEIIDDLGDFHAVILNRNRRGSMPLPGESLLLMEMCPALFAAFAANEAEKAAPQATLVDVQMIGAAGRVFFSGDAQQVRRARAHIENALENVAGREPLATNQ